jgi:glycosyltransferase involved in cell wall biosynthesis
MGLPGREQIDGVDVIRLPIRYPWPAPYRFGLLRRAGHWLQRSALPDLIQQPLLGYFARSMPPLLGLQSTAERLIAETDLVHAIDATWDGPFTVASRATHMAGKPFVAMPLVHSGSAHILAHATMSHQRMAYHQAAAVIALTQGEKDLLAAQGVAKEQIHVLSMGVEADPVGDLAPLPAEFRRQSGLSDPFVLFLGAATYDKGAFTLARTVVDLHRRGVDLWVACAGPQRQQLQRFIEAQPHPDRQLLRERVRLLGVVDEPTKRALLCACTALALPSRVDSFGIVLLEAWLHGKPVVAASEGGLIEIVTQDETGLLVPFDDSLALGNAITRLLQNSALARRLGEQGRSHVLSRYTWDHTYEALSYLYEQIERAERSHAQLHTAALRGAGGLSTAATARAGSERDALRG